ncbi:hypothetical protein [Gemmobacter nectariphilus]|uniref:hypothetical protein n=1 Tax=Gemmobacter nectariphilus TaxID=220343 RepID=UPI0012B62FD2|nr:hypothetical protein [Gemmobacter nectariphilus]
MLLDFSMHGRLACILVCIRRSTLSVLVLLLVLLLLLESALFSPKLFLPFGKRLTPFPGNAFQIAGNE